MWKQRDDDVEKGLVMRPINLELMNEMERIQKLQYLWDDAEAIISLDEIIWNPTTKEPGRRRTG